MNTIKYLAFSLLLVAFTLHGAPIWTMISTTGQGGDIKTYSAYYCTKQAAKDMFGGADTIDGISKYLSKNEDNYKKGMDALKKDGTALDAYGIDAETGEYVFSKYLQSALADGDFIAVVAKSGASSNAKDSVRVMSAASSGGSLEFNPTEGKGSGGDWVQAPEPTSGILLLLGIAGLALKRKQK